MKHGSITRIAVHPDGTHSRTLRILSEDDHPDSTKSYAAFWANELPDLQRVVSSRAADVFLGHVPGRPDPVYFKRFLMRNLADRLKHLFRASRARRALRGGEMASALGHRVPQPVGLIEETWMGIVTGSALATAALQDAPTVTELLIEPSTSPSIVRRKLRLISALGEEVGRWHASGICHGDMRAGNVLWREENGVYGFYWLDNEGNRMTRSLARRARNLTQANMTTCGITMLHRFRFWRAYIRAAGYEDEYARRLLRDVLRQTRKRWRKRGRTWPTISRKHTQ